MAKDSGNTNYELKDVKPGLVGYSLLGTAIITILSFIVCVWFTNYLLATPSQIDVQPSKLAPERTIPAAPLLQPVPMEELAAYEDQQEHRLESYTLIDEEADKVAIPIEHAIDLLAERGLSRAVPAAAPEAATE